MHTVIINLPSKSARTTARGIHYSLPLPSLSPAPAVSPTGPPAFSVSEISVHSSFTARLPRQSKRRIHARDPRGRIQDAAERGEGMWSPYKINGVDVYRTE